MKRKTKEILSGVLALSMVLGTPAGMDAAETSENSSKMLTEEALESQSETGLEQCSEVVSEDKSKSTSNEILNETSETDSELIPEETTEINNDMEEEWVEIPVAFFTPEISDEGELDYRRYVDEGADLMIQVKKSEADSADSKSIQVKNSSLYDSDFYIELSGDGQTRQYTCTEWLEYLEDCHGWVDDQVEVKLSDTGKKYFDSIQMEEQDSDAGKGKKSYTFWAVNSDKNVSTKDVENGTRGYTAGRDMEAPVLKAFCTDNECHEPESTDTEQYFASDFIIRGTYCDDLSGVVRIEYTADMRPEEGAVWIPVENTQESEDLATDFQIALTDGCYPAIAVRAVDEAGNISEASPLVNDDGEYIQVVVDSAAPVLTFDVSAGGQPYSGENDNWTNEDVRIVVTPNQDSCSYAGIARYECAYVKVGEDMTDVSEKWTELPVLEKSFAELVITEDVNGYYLFRAISKAGIETAEDAKLRVLIQHQAAGIKPIIVSGADETKCRDGWYNQQSGTPEIRFEYPDYDTGVISGEYDAPVTIHYQLTRSDSVPDGAESEWSDKADGVTAADQADKKAVIGVMSCSDVLTNDDGSKEFVLTMDDLSQHVVDLGCEDGFYTLQYWTTDAAGNASERLVYHYKLDCHEPTDLTMELAGSSFVVGKESTITYGDFYSNTVSGSADAQYGISGKGSLVIGQAKKIGEWMDRDSGSLESQDSICISPNTRCFLYVRAEDAAGNVAEGWTNGIVVDNMAPNESTDGSGKELMVEPKCANEHGFFNDDITVDIQVRDAPEDDNCAALESVTSSVGRDGTDTIAAQELFSFTKAAPTEEELAAASGFEGTQLIDARANESNEAYIEVTAIDRSGNTKTSTLLLKIDVTRPEVELRFDNNEAVNGNYYSKGRTVTVCVRELNFDPDGVSVLVTKDGQMSEATLSDWKSDGSGHYASFTLAEDGEYSIAASCVDLADNVSDEVRSETFIIDRTAPEMTIGLTGGQETQTADGAYFHTGVTAKITITEHNFRTEDFVIHMTPVSESGTWSHEGDVHILRIPFEEDNRYQIDCAYRDMAGNAADAVERSFTIDTSAPVIIIDGVEDNSANREDILPVISVLDANLEQSGIAVSVTTGIGDVVDNEIVTSRIDEGDGTGYSLTLPDMTGKPDNIYYLNVSACDQAGNETAVTYRFSLNRKGSVYDLTAFMQLMQQQYHTYETLSDIRIVEMNIDTVEEFEIYVSRNGALGYEAGYTREVSGSEETGYTYVYQIGRENFSAEGIYRMTLYSRDRAGNEVNNASNIHGEEITFIIDNTPPKVVIDGVASGMVYDVDAQEVHVAVIDNFELAEAEFTLVNRDNKVLESWDYMELAGEDEALSIMIPQHDEMVSLLYRVKDAAGNEMRTCRGERTSPDDFLVTTDKYVQFINKPSQTTAGRLMLFAGGVSGVLALSVVIVLRYSSRRKNSCN